VRRRTDPPLGGPGSAGRSLGLPRGTVLLHDHDPRWAHEYERAAAVLDEALGDVVSVIEHVGSTAVRGLVAKPVLDIAVAYDPGRFREARDRLEVAGYEYRGDLGENGGQLFAKGPETARTEYVHLVPAGSRQWRRFLAFRDALRGDRRLRDRYADLKGDLAERFPSDRVKYAEGKSRFIEDATAGYSERRSTAR
jgi:GrpB-like predicted nucleotidyltransferase (UPF0157 family)